MSDTSSQAGETTATLATTSGRRPTKATCRKIRPTPWRPATGRPTNRGTLRVFAIQYKQEIDNVRSYRSFRTAMHCFDEDFVVPHLDPHKPTLVVFPEDVGS